VTVSTLVNAPLVLIDPAVESDAARTIASVGYDAGRAASSPDRVGEALLLATAWGTRLERPARGRTAELWSALATLGSVDLTVARVVEPHLDALAILDEAHVDLSAFPRDATWGVYAAEGPGQRLTAMELGSRWVLDGQKPWCSLADRLSHALVTAWVDDRTRGLFAVDLGEIGVRADGAEGEWVSHGLPQVTSCAIEVTRVRARPVGAPGWYLERPGFAWGGVGVAAVWFGAAVALARRVGAHVTQRPADQVAQLHVGQLDLALATAREALATAAGAADGSVDGPPAGLIAARTRSIVAESVETVIRVADHAMGPAPLATDAEHAQRVSDLRLYVRQHHAERDLADLGRRVLDQAGSGVPW
jgi:alkylation response protein AidB-like acyl-CoA dehydrogenase